MAALTPVRLFSEGTNLKASLYRVRNVDTNDTISVSTDYYRIHVAAAFNASRGQAYDAPAVSGTTITLDEASMVDDVVYVFVLGVGATS